MAAIQRIERGTIQFIETLEGWDRAVPTTLITAAATADERYAALHRFVARALALHPALVAIERGPDRPPLVGKPLGAGLYLSTASRGEVVALAVAPGPAGTDVEILDLDAEIPWHVLHPTEAEGLRVQAGRAQAMGFTRLWSLKEAYLKALGVGLRREPATFAVEFVDGEAATVRDPESRAELADARTAWRAVKGVWIAVSTVVLARERG